MNNCWIPPLQLDRFRVQASISWRCNFYDYKKQAPFGSKCNYCNLWSPSQKENSFVTFGSKSIPVARELAPKEWVRGMHMVRQGSGVKVLWDFTGGEPLIYDGLGEMLQGARSYSDWAITSNTSLTKRIHELFGYNIDIPTSWTASWHPASGFPIEEFLENIRFIRSLGTYTSVTIVLHHSTKATIKADLKRFHDEGFFTQIHLFHREGWSLANDDDKELHDLYAELSPLNRAPAEDFDKTPDGYGDVRDCVAGFRSVVVSSDGQVFWCYRHGMVEPDPPIGQWGTWVPSKDVLHGCTWPCNFACDLRNVIPARAPLGVQISSRQADIRG